MIQFDSEDPVEQSDKKTTLQVGSEYKMIYIKGTLVGIVTLVGATIVYLICLTFVLMRRYPPPQSGEVSLDLRAVMNGPLFWLVALAGFAIGFYWECRRP